MAEVNTRVTDVSVDAFIDGVEPPRRREDARVLRDLLGEITGEPARMWGPTMIGFGSYLLSDFAGPEDLLARLGKHRTGKSCLYVNKLANVEMDVLRNIATACWRHMQERYPA